MPLMQTGDTYLSSQYAKALCVAEPKQGKTVFLVAGMLGQLPWQTEGAVVDAPENLLVVCFDAGALSGIKPFILNSCKGRPEALKYRVLNFQEDVRQAAASGGEYDLTFYNNIMAGVSQQIARSKGTGAVLFSSLTGMSFGLERSIMGPPHGRGYGDPDKWKQLAHQLTQIQNMVQSDKWHCIWEGHVDKKVPFSMGKGGDDELGGATEKLAGMSGSAGKMWPYNVEQVFRIRRVPGMKFKGSNVDQAYLDSQPDLDFMTGGRCFNEFLNQKEPDITVAFRKLGLKVGHWGSKK